MSSLVPKNRLTVKELSAQLAKLIKAIMADLDFEDKELSGRLAKILSDLKKMDDLHLKMMDDFHLKMMDDLHLKDMELSARLAKIDCEIKRIIADL